MDSTPDDARLNGEVSCFVIGPIGDKFAERGTADRQLYEESLRVYDEVGRGACHEHGLRPLRADAIADTGEITDHIHQRLQSDDIVIADVSTGNPNVMYELGYRNGIGKPVILIGESGKLPFDIAQLRTIRFRRTESSLHEARDQLSRVLKEGLSRGFRSVAHVGVSVAEREPDTEEDDEDDDEPGVGDRLALAEEQMESVVQDIEAMGEALMDMASVAEAHTPDPDAAAELSASARLAMVGRFAKAVAEPAGAFRSRSESFSERMSVIEGGIHALFDITEALPAEDRDEDTGHFLQQIIDLAECTREGATHVAEFGTVMKTAVGFSRLLRAPGRDVAVAVRTVTSIVPRIEALESRARVLLAQTPAPSSPAGDDTGVPVLSSDRLAAS
ncbi:hypothetical protein [Streptomyces sp. NPDC058305]|uniref:hypothetical protein n=1 Tax=Streptomyces sp. NPDC058305 TaxID=3346438 RepID=UPI0036F06F42